MTKLTPLAVQNMDLLHALADGGWATRRQLAEGLQRDESNVGKTLKALHEAELISEANCKAKPTAAGTAAIAAWRRAEGNEPSAGAALAGHAELLWIQIDPDPLNPRKHFDPEAIDELANSIARDGLLENLVVRTNVSALGRWILNDVPQPQYRLVAGERRHRAIRRLIERGEWPMDKPITCKVVDLDDAGHRRVALIENLQRKDLRPIDEANALKELMAIEGKGTSEIAKDIGFTQRFVQQRLQLLELPEKLQDQVNAGELPIERAREAVAIWPKLPAVKQVELREGKITVEAARDWLAKQPKPLDLAADQWLLALEVYDKSQRRPLDERSRYVEVHADARFDDRVGRLTTWPNNLFNAVAHVLDVGGETGRFQIGLSYEGECQLRIKFGEDVMSERGRLRALDSLYGELGVVATPPLYRTPWLVGPFEISEGLRQDIEVARKARAERAAAFRTARAAEDAQRAAEHAAKRARLDRAKTGEAELLKTGNFSVNAPKLCVEIGAPLPWFLDEQLGIIHAANGEAVNSRPWQLSIDELARLRLIVTLANAGAGLATPAEPPGDEDMPQDAFERVVVNCLLDDCEDLPEDPEDAQKEAEARASLGLAAFLRETGLAFGGPGQCWTYEAAMDLAARIRQDGPGLQVDLEEAIVAKAFAGAEGA